MHIDVPEEVLRHTELQPDDKNVFIMQTRTGYTEYVLGSLLSNFHALVF